MLRAAILLTLLAGPLHAGAWPRGDGNSFLASASRVEAPHPAGPYSLYTTVYYEYGLTDRLTLGLDYGRGVSGRHKTVAFLRWPLADRPGGTRLALELGVGQIAGAAVLRPGVSYGHGFSAGDASGWLALDSVAEFRPTTRRTDFKADITFGLSYSARLKAILQLQTGLSSGDPAFARLAPSLVLRTSAKSNVEIGMTAGLAGDNNIGLKLGFWHDF